MRFSSMTVALIALCLGSLAANSFAELTVIRELPRSVNGPYTFTCVSEDDRSALIWNYDLHFWPLHHESKPSDFLPTQPGRDSNCSITGEGTCIAKWENTTNWYRTHSVDRPMGPVFDSRWENFAETYFPPKNKDDKKNYTYVREVPRSGAVVFSARGLGDVDLKLCKDNITSRTPCFTITIAASAQRKFKIYSSSEEVAWTDRSIVDASEWRTFTLKWNETSRKEGVYKATRFIYDKLFSAGINVNHLFIRSNDAGRVRFHFYEYLMTETNNTMLISKRIDYSENNYCIELLVSLCAQCQLEVSVVHPTNASSPITNVTAPRPLKDKLPTWQNVKINVPFRKPKDSNSSYFKLKLVTKLNQNAVNGLWAIDSFRQCGSSSESKGNVSKSTVTVDAPLTLASPSLPKIGCQRLNYDSHAPVIPGVPVTDKIENELSKYNRGELSPCWTSRRNNSCWGTSMCQSSGCFCATGFRGDDCKEYDENDREIRYLCKTGTPNFAGFCDGSCVGHYLPPSCRTELKPPHVVNRTAKEAWVNYTGFENQEIKSVLFQLKSHSGSRWKTVSSVVMIPQLYLYTLHLPDLSKPTTYTVRATVTTTRGWTVNFPDLTLPTPCSSVWYRINLAVTFERNGLVKIRWQSPGRVITAYEVEIESLNTTLKNEQPWNDTVLTKNLAPRTTPFELQVYLSTATWYKFSIKARDACVHTEIKRQVPPSLGLDIKGKLILDRSQTWITIITIKIPSIVNETLNTVLYVVVKGSPPCTNSPVPNYLRELLNMTKSDEGWLAKKFKARETRPENLTIGKDTGDVNPETCSLDRYETYVIAVVAWDSNDEASAVITSSPSKPIETMRRTDNESNPQNLVWLLLLPILLICFGLCFLWRSKFKNIYKRMQLPPGHDGDNISLATIGTPSLDWPFDSCPHPVKLKKFEESVKRSLEKGELEAQFGMLPRGLMQPCRIGSLPANKHKNKYENIIAYDETRVILRNDSPRFHDGYINANYIQGYCKDKAYIAAQGPKPETVVDFWRMIWQEKVCIICMMVNVIEGGEIMCEQYWPEIGKTVEYGSIAIMNIRQRVYAHYTYRTFQLTKDQETESRKVEHLQYTGWPEQGMPMYSHSIVEYLNELRATPSGPGPIVVHCNAGVGRTGTLILCDICLDYTAAEGTVDLFVEAKKMYSARANMLDNLQQYILAHLMPTQCLLLIPTKLPCSDVSLETIEKLKGDLTVHIRRLAVSSWKDKALYPSEPQMPPNPDHIAKNRFATLMPVEHSIVSLKPYPPDDSDSEYISAVSVDGVKSKGLYLASQLPLSSTLSDFWRLVAEKRVELIVILQRPGPEGLDCVDVVPQETHFFPVPYITVENKMWPDYHQHFTTDKLLLMDTSEEEAVVSWNVTVLTCNDWSLAEDSEPPSPEALVALWSASERVSRTDQGPTLVLCHDGVTGCGLYLALSIILERMAVEQECDVILAARVVRRSRPDFVYSKAQFEYLYDATLEFMRSFKNYDNFA